MATTAADRYRRAKNIAFAVLDLDPAGRAKAARARCSGDDELYREVQWLLQAAEEDDPYDGIGASLNQMARRAVEAVRLEVPLPRGYRLLRRLDSGGMAVVYLAARIDGDLHQNVALKLLRLGFDNDDSNARRFVAEGQILSSLSHPNIAHLLDAGLTAEGRPFLAMEYVKGERIDRWCDRLELPLKGRIELFLKVCAAVEHAHRHLVIHRDIKPANILVTADGEPKLLDFGIARLLAEDSSVTRTKTGLQALTPAYASPEQIEGHGLSVATDVYSLGVVLYELATGVRPFDDSTPPHLLSTAIVAGEIVPPSKRMRHRPTGSSASAPEPAQLRSPFRRRLPADIDAIVLKAMRREPEHRYASVAELAGDLRSFLAARPVEARRGHRLYRAQRFIRRRRGALAIGSILLLLLISFVVNREVQLTRIGRERDRAEAEAAKARQVSDILTGLFRGVDPREARGAEITAQELLDRGVARVDRELTGQPELRAHMLHVLGRTYLELGLYDPAETLLNRALESRRSRLGARHPDVGRTLSDLGLLATQQGNFAHAREQLEEATQILEDSLGRDTSEFAEALERSARIDNVLENYETSLRTYERALTIQRRVSGEMSGRVAVIYSNMGGLLFRMGALDRAEKSYEAALSIYEQKLGRHHPHIGAALDGLAKVRLVRGELDSAEELHRRSLALIQGAYGAKHHKTGYALNNLGHVLVQSGRSDEAVAVLRQAVNAIRSTLGHDHPHLAYPLSTLGDAHLAAGRPRQAREFYTRSTAALEKNPGTAQFHPVIAHNIVRIGKIEADRGNSVEAKELMIRAVEIWRGAPKGVDPQLASSLLELGRWLLSQKRCAEAMPLLERAALISRAREVPSSAEVAELREVWKMCSERDPATMSTRALE